MPNVFTSSVVDAPVDDVWGKIRDFNDLNGWHPAVKESSIEGGLASDQIGCIRNFNLQDGSNIREQLLALSDVDHACTYSILESGMGVENYVATLRLLPVTDGNRTYAKWTASFDCAADAEKDLMELIGNDVFQGGFDALKRIFG